MDPIHLKSTRIIQSDKFLTVRKRRPGRFLMTQPSIHNITHSTTAFFAVRQPHVIWKYPKRDKYSNSEKAFQVKLGNFPKFWFCIILFLNSHGGYPFLPGDIIS